MNRDKNLKRVAHFCSLFLFCSLFFNHYQVSAKTRFSTDLVTPHYFFWLVMISVTFVQGALNGLFILTLRNLKHAHAGNRWTQGFWAGFPCAFLICYLTFSLINYIHDTESIRQLDPLVITIWLALFLCLNAISVFQLSNWAAQES